MPLDPRSVLVETPVTRWLSALNRGAENGRSVCTGGRGVPRMEAFMRPMLYRREPNP